MLICREQCLPLTTTLISLDEPTCGEQFLPKTETRGSQDGICSNTSTNHVGSVPNMDALSGQNEFKPVENVPSILPSIEIETADSGTMPTILNIEPLPMDTDVITGFSLKPLQIKVEKDDNISLGTKETPTGTAPENNLPCTSHLLSVKVEPDSGVCQPKVIGELRHMNEYTSTYNNTLPHIPLVVKEVKETARCVDNGTDTHLNNEVTSPSQCTPYPFTCGICGAQYRNWGDILNHMPFHYLHSMQNNVHNIYAAPPLATSIMNHNRLWSPTLNQVCIRQPMAQYYSPTPAFGYLRYAFSPCSTNASTSPGFR